MNLFVTVARDVDHIAIGGANEESAQSPGLFREWVNDLEPTPFGLLIRLFNAGANNEIEMTESLGALASRVTSWT